MSSAARRHALQSAAALRLALVAAPEPKTLSPAGTIPSAAGALTLIRLAAAPTMLKTISFEIHDETAPALRSAIDELKSELGERLRGPHSWAREQALTDAVRAVSVLFAAICKVVPDKDPYFSNTPV